MLGNCYTRHIPLVVPTLPSRSVPISEEIQMSEKQSISRKPETNSPKPPGLMPNLLINIIIPAVILMKFSGDAWLGPLWGLIIALSFPLGFGLWDLARRRKFNGFSILGLVSVLLTGGISLMELDPKYIAIKEAAIPGLLGIGVWISQYTRFPVVEKLLLNPQMVDREKLYSHLEAKQQRGAFGQVLRYAAMGVTGAFMLSAVLNYVLARMIVVSPAGSEAFNQELGRLTALSFPVIVLPTMIVLLGSIFFVFWKIGKLTGESIETFLFDDSAKQ